MDDANPKQLHLNGEYVAAILAAMTGLLALGAVVLASALNKGFETRVFDLGRWLPHADRIGPYSGKETVTLVVWLVSWLILHLALRRRTMDPRPWFGLALVMLLAALVMIWPPTWHALGAA